MISFNDACDLIKKHAKTTEIKHVALHDALNQVLAKDIKAPIDLPPFDNSAVDGFAVKASSLLNLRLGDIVRAEAQSVTKILPGVAIKIMTGAPLPIGADAVAMREDVTLLGGILTFKKPPTAKENIRFRGEDIGQGKTIAEKGVLLNPQLIALFAGLGLTSIPVWKPPRIKIISTGDELVNPGQPLNHGQVYFLMDSMLRAQCARIGIKDVSCELVGDEFYAIMPVLERAWDADIVLITGGMSKGDYDYTLKALKEHGAEEIFYEGSWRPGKPLYFGRKGQSLIFGLPGNPVAAFVCFRIFVTLAIYGAMKGGEALAVHFAQAQNEMSKKTGLTFFARAHVDKNNGLSFLPGQGSHQIFSLSKANALCVVPEGKAIVKAFEVVQYYPL